MAGFNASIKDKTGPGKKKTGFAYTQPDQWNSIDCFWHKVGIVLEPNPNISCVLKCQCLCSKNNGNKFAMMLWKSYELGLKTPSYNMIGNPIRLLRVAWDSTKLAVQVIAKNKQRAVVVSENQQAVAKQYRSDSYFTV